MSLHTEHYGAGPDLVLLHGWGLSSAIWQPLIEPLASHYRLTLIDIPGLGQSPTLECTSIDSVAEMLLDGAPERAVWLGWSLGGALALAVANRAPERVSQLVLTAATPCFVQRDDWPCAMAEETFDAFASGLGDNGAKTLSRFAMLQTQGSTSARQELRLLKQVIAASAADEQGLVATLALLAEDLRPLLAHVSHPLMLMLGEQDPLVPIEMAEHIGSLRADAVIRRYATAAHLPFITEPARFIEDLDDFIAGSRL
ncbi:pimeloyl-[acyl-carrier protein] methyl ester esterase [Marinobacterium zhoushanense]|uniref:Pimeloyl-[acyl-carrier protein] methyl ester esterase n=1 Tax=Marinobacterium zhoushanense TaxID=1679163 RepID=A0ABQ1K6M2_9GAMM|nr:pimeloyl-ACP methyl ester esterase BioH [Marinobacterium zhoushanense]GGB88324.1 pimeloyl-[acyl-carrier protein] methyl ester esterase [Marinobacterium zhoushanense]